jgi:Rha family phage regulatory protein
MKSSKQLVKLDSKGTPITDSLMVAEVFGKRHDKVIDNIRTLIAGGVSGFEEMTYQNSRNQTYPKYTITKGALSLLAFVYKGAKYSEARKLFAKAFSNSESGNTTKDLVRVTEDNKVITDSLMVAEVFERRHSHVLESIRLRIKKGLPGFREVEYQNSRNQTYPMYTIDAYGFSLLIIGFNRAKDLEFKKRFIEAFFEMEQRLKQPKALNDPATLRQLLLGYKEQAIEPQETIKVQSPTHKLPDFTNPAEAARAWADQYEGRMLAEETIKVQAPTIESFDHSINEEVYFTIPEVAMMLGTPRKSLINYLVESEWFFWIGDKIEPYPDMEGSGLMEFKAGVFKDGYSFDQAYVTPKGLDYINKYYFKDTLN